MDPDPQNKTYSRSEAFERYKQANMPKNLPDHLFETIDHDAFHDLQAGLKKPRSALPSLSYFSPIKTIYAVVYASMVFSILAHACYQLWYAWRSGQGLDADVAGYTFGAVFFLVAAVGAAAQLQRVTLRLGLRRQAKQQTIVVGYRSSLSPVEAGVLLNAYCSDYESRAVMTSLMRRGFISPGTSAGGLGIRQTVGRDIMTPDEQIFVNSLFNDSDEAPAELMQSKVAVAGQTMQTGVYRRMQQSGDLPDMTTMQVIQYYVLKILSIVGFPIGGLLFALLFDPNSYVILYPRYPVAFWQLGFIVVLLMILILVPLRAYCTNVFSKTGLEKYREAAGLYMYIETVLKGRFQDGNLAQSEIDYYLPYAQAFGLER